MILELVLIGITSFLMYIYWCQTYSDFGKKLNKFPGREIIPFLGNVLEMQIPTGMYIYKKMEKL